MTPEEAFEKWEEWWNKRQHDTGIEGLILYNWCQQAYLEAYLEATDRAVGIVQKKCKSRDYTPCRSSRTPCEFCERAQEIRGSK